MRQITTFDSILNINDYFYYKKIFKAYISNIKSKQIEIIAEELIDRIFKSCQKSVQSYIDFDEFSKLMEDILIDLGFENDKINEIKRIKTNVKSRDITSLKKKPIEILAKSKNKVYRKYFYGLLIF